MEEWYYNMGMTNRPKTVLPTGTSGVCHRSRDRWNACLFMVGTICPQEKEEDPGSGTKLLSQKDPQVWI